MNKINLSFNSSLKSLPIVIAVCFLISVVFSALFLYPRFDALRTIKNNVKQRKEYFQQQEDYFSALSSAKSELEAYKDVLAKINSSLPDDPSMPSLFSFLQKASSQSGVVLKGISSFITSPSTEFPTIKSTQLSLEVMGTYGSLKNFISVLEKSSRIIEVGNISFSSPKEASSFVFSLRIKVYSY